MKYPYLQTSVATAALLLTFAPAFAAENEDDSSLNTITVTATRTPTPTPTPTGWIHWQDNIKMGMKDGKLLPFIQESVLNTYAKAADFNAQRADDYWAKTKDYWVAVRDEWDAIILRDKGVHVTEVAESGSAAGSALMAEATKP